MLLFKRAIELDPGFASAYGRAALCYVARKVNRWTIDAAQEASEAIRFARLAVDGGKNDAIALSFGGFALAYSLAKSNMAPTWSTVRLLLIRT